MTDRQLLARWTGTIEGTSCTPLEFYKMVEQAVLEKELSGIRFATITHREGGWLTSKRVYLRIRRKKLFFDICFFPVGNSSVVSWWLHCDQFDVIDLFTEIPVVSFFIKRTIRATTYYSIDLVQYFQKAVHAAILQILDRLTEENHLNLLNDEERRPVWEEIW